MFIHWNPRLLGAFRRTTHAMACALLVVPLGPAAHAVEPWDVFTTASFHEPLPSVLDDAGGPFGRRVPGWNWSAPGADRRLRTAIGRIGYLESDGAIPVPPSPPNLAEGPAGEDVLGVGPIASIVRLAADPADGASAGVPSVPGDAGEGAAGTGAPGASVPDVDAAGDDAAGDDLPGDTYGQAPRPDGSEQVFLRTQSPLLDGGEWQFDYGLVYTYFEYDFPTITNGDLVRTDLRRRTLAAPLAVRYGWTDRLQLFGNVPVGWRHNELATSSITTATPFDLNSDAVGIGDIQLGFNYLWRSGGDGVPAIILTGNAGLPTGERLGLTSLFQGGLGTGFGSVGGQALFVHTYDPVVVFWGAGYNYYFADDQLGVRVQLGGQATYQLGVGFAVNDRVTLSTAFLGAFISETQVDGLGIPDTQQEPMRMRFALTASRNCRIVEPFAEIGMTSAAPAARLGVVWTY